MQSGKENKKPTTRKEALEVLLGQKCAALTLFRDARLHILRARNGAVLVTSTGADVFEFENGELKGLSELHYSIDEALGFAGSKHDRTRIRHVIEHGSNYICHDKDCPICHGELE
jgi:hypothetical protein